MVIPDVPVLGMYGGGFAAATGAGWAFAGRIVRFIAPFVRDFVASTARNEVHSASQVALLKDVLATQQAMLVRMQVLEAVYAAERTVPLPLSHQPG